MERLLRPMDDSQSIRDRKIVRLVTYLMHNRARGLKRIVEETGIEDAGLLLRENPDLFQEVVYRKTSQFRLFYADPAKSA